MVKKSPKDLCPAEFRAGMELFKREHIAILEDVKYLEKMLLVKNRKGTDWSFVTGFKKISQIFTKYSVHFAGKVYGDHMENLGVITETLSLQTQKLHEQAFKRAVLPLKIWATEDFPQLKREMAKCQRMGVAAKKAENNLKKRPNNKERKLAAERTMNAFENQYAFCKQEINNATVVFHHHRFCMQVMLSLQCKYYTFATSQFDPNFIQEMAVRSQASAHEAHISLTANENYD